MQTNPVESPAVLFINHRHCAVGAGSTLVQLWEETVAEDVNAAKVLLAEFTKTRRAIASLVIVSTDSPIPDADARAALEQLAKLFPADTRCIAYVYEGRGMRATAIRSIMTLLGLVQARPLPVKVSSTVEEALAWMSRVLGDGGSEAAGLRERGVALARETMGRARRGR